MAHTSPTVARWELALRLKRRREELQMSVKTITDHLGFSRNYWSMVENEKASLADDKFKSLMHLFDFDSATAAELDELRVLSRERGWWDRVPPELVGEDGARLYGLEAGASRIRSSESNLVTGLLQTDAYAEALMRSDPAVSEVQIRDRVEIRRQRQKLLSGDLYLTALMGQGTLLQEVGGRQVLRDQLLHLHNIGMRFPEKVNIRILPFSAGSTPVIGSSTLYLLDFHRTILPTVAWQETLLMTNMSSEPSLLTHLVLSFERALSESYDASKSLAMLAEAESRLST